MFFKSVNASNGRGVLINTDKVNTIEPTSTAVKVTFDNGETVDIQADFNRLQNMIAAVVVPDGAFPD